MKIKKNDKIKVLSGKDKGKTGKVLQIFPNKKRASVEGLNILIKHMRSNKEGEKGQRIEFPAPFDMSNMVLICPKCGKTVKTRYKIIKSEDKKIKKYRECKKCKQIID